MAKIKLTKTAVEAAQPQATAIELRDTVVPGFLGKITPAGRRVFMLQYRTNAGERRKPALGLFGELTVEQARVMAQDWLAEVRRGGDPGGAKAEARKAPTMAELCKKFMEDYSKKRNKPSTQEGYLPGHGLGAGDHAGHRGHQRFASAQAGGYAFFSRGQALQISLGGLDFLARHRAFQGFEALHALGGESPRLP